MLLLLLLSIILFSLSTRRKTTVYTAFVYLLVVRVVFVVVAQNATKLRVFVLAFVPTNISLIVSTLFSRQSSLLSIHQPSQSQCLLCICFCETSCWRELWNNQQIPATRTRQPRRQLGNPASSIISVHCLTGQMHLVYGNTVSFSEALSLQLKSPLLLVLLLLLLLSSSFLTCIFGLFWLMTICYANKRIGKLWEYFFKVLFYQNHLLLSCGLVRRSFYCKKMQILLDVLRILLVIK